LPPFRALSALVDGGSRDEHTLTQIYISLRLVLLALLLALALGRLEADLLVVLLEGRQVLAGLGELARPPPSMPSPTYQCTKARLAYIRSNLWSMCE